MEKLIIKGGKKLSGTISVSGAKNVALKAFVAACLTKEKVIIQNVPLITDIFVMADIIRELGGKVEFTDHSAVIRLKDLKSDKIYLDRAAEVRTSFMFLAPLLARKKSAIIPNPGGCRIGARPIDRVIKGLKKMGVSIKYNSKDGYFHSYTKDGLKGAYYKFSKNTHTGTEALILASVLAKGKTVLENAAQEPEIDELIKLLNFMGAKVKRTKPRTVEVQGVKKLHGTKFKISPDRNEVVTFAIAALLTGGDIFIKNIGVLGLTEFITELERAGAGFEIKDGGIRFFYSRPLLATKVTTAPYPGFMTDWQAPWAVLMTKAKGDSIVHETVYESRLGYARQLRKMGAKVKFFNPEVKNPKSIYNFNMRDDNNLYHALKIKGPTKLHNAVVRVTDLRAGATLVLAALSARGESIILDVEHLDRGYEEFDKRLNKLGASIIRVSDEKLK
jgi:UDP-N-acetylglucosamine 1-carboxyvinyltransferase